MIKEIKKEIDRIDSLKYDIDGLIDDMIIKVKEIGFIIDRVYESLENAEE